MTLDALGLSLGADHLRTSRRKAPGHHMNCSLPSLKSRTKLSVPSAFSFARRDLSVVELLLFSNVFWSRLAHQPVNSRHHDGASLRSVHFHSRHQPKSSHRYGSLRTASTPARLRPKLTHVFSQFILPPALQIQPRTPGFRRLAAPAILVTRSTRADAARDPSGGRHGTPEIGRMAEFCSSTMSAQVCSSHNTPMK